VQCRNASSTADKPLEKLEHHRRHNWREFPRRTEDELPANHTQLIGFATSASPQHVKVIAKQPACQTLLDGDANAGSVSFHLTLHKPPNNGDVMSHQVKWTWLNEHGILNPKTCQNKSQPLICFSDFSKILRQTRKAFVRQTPLSIAGWFWCVTVQLFLKPANVTV